MKLVIEEKAGTKFSELSVGQYFTLQTKKCLYKKLYNGERKDDANKFHSFNCINIMTGDFMNFLSGQLVITLYVNQIICSEG